MRRLSDYEIAVLERPELVEAQALMNRWVQEWIYDRSHEAEVAEVTEVAEVAEEGEQADVAELALVHADAAWHHHDEAGLRALVVAALCGWYEQARRHAEATGRPMRQVTEGIVPAMLSEVVRLEDWPLSYGGIMVEEADPGDLSDLEGLGEAPDRGEG
ncbi:hypothetical protein ACFP1Z_10685 [Streptomyces gamaensis]|uniref:Uncharacterized protein n=1 Tax=Streptomyces gamaensis TaxID=1763542 RepID=A0ABW0YYB6_9ACTN